jgi:hypothetical protein
MLDNVLSLLIYIWYRKWFFRRSIYINLKNNILYSECIIIKENTEGVIKNGQSR